MARLQAYQITHQEKPGSTMFVDQIDYVIVKGNIVVNRTKGLSCIYVGADFRRWVSSAKIIYRRCKYFFAVQKVTLGRDFFTRHADKFSSDVSEDTKAKV